MNVLVTKMCSLHVDIDSGFYTVKFDSVLLKDVAVEADCIIPPLRENDPLSSDSDPDDIGDGHDVAFAKGVYVLQYSCQSKHEVILQVLPKIII